jgi:hypothetical protein
MTAAQQQSLLSFTHDVPPAQHQDADIPDGCCPLCGIQLYKIRRWSGAGRKKAVPLNQQGLVDNGQCLTCNNDEIDSQGNNTTLYIGELNMYGQRQGPGELIWGNGDRYVGNFFNGVRDGTGTLLLKDGKLWTSLKQINNVIPTSPHPAYFYLFLVS